MPIRAIQERERVEITPDVQTQIDLFREHVSQLTLEQLWELAKKVWGQSFERRSPINNMQILLRILGHQQLSDQITQGFKKDESHFGLLSELLGEKLLGYTNSDAVHAIASYQPRMLLRYFVESLFGAEALSEPQMNEDFIEESHLSLTKTAEITLELPASDNSLGFVILEEIYGLSEYVDAQQVIGTIVELTPREYAFPLDTLVGWLCIDGSVISADINKSLN